MIHMTHLSIFYIIFSFCIPVFFPLICDNDGWHACFSNTSEVQLGANMFEERPRSLGTTAGNLSKLRSRAIHYFREILMSNIDLGIWSSGSPHRRDGLTTSLRSLGIVTTSNFERNERPGTKTENKLTCWQQTRFARE